MFVTMCLLKFDNSDILHIPQPNHKSIFVSTSNGGGGSFHN